jgi:hypothetical protein
MVLPDVFIESAKDYSLIISPRRAQEFSRREKKTFTITA